MINIYFIFLINIIIKNKIKNINIKRKVILNNKILLFKIKNGIYILCVTIL
jgi:hypothetical protein